jgi:phage terminase large subunit
MKARKKVIQGGTSAGKTFGILPILIDKALKTPNLEISVVSESIPHLRRGALKDFVKILQLTNRFKDHEWNKTLLTYRFYNGSYIEFFSAESEDKLRGARRNILYINEANNIDFESYNQLAIRTSGDIYIDFNPTAEFWAHTEVLKDLDSELVILTYKDNEGLPKTIVDELESKRERAKTSEYWANWCKVYLDGQVGNLEGVIFSNYKQISEIPKEARLLGIGVDFGYTNDPTAAVAFYKYNEELILDELIYQSGLLNSDIANILKPLNTWAYCDSAEPKSIAELNRYGLRAKGAAKGKDSIIFGIQLLQSKQLLITNRSTNIIKELRGYVWEKDQTGKTLNKPIGVNDHAIAAMRYFAVENLNQSKKPTTFY